jgi:type IV pilus assembly protein PilM
MTLWNPLHVFGSPQRGTAEPDPAASFDPSRIGDPVRSGQDRPSIGYADTKPREGVGGTGSSRRAIGFAPPQDAPEPRYRTEISFKRHHQAPSASVTGDVSGTGEDAGWETPETSMPVDTGSGEDIFEAGETASELEVSDLPEPDEKRVPFYRREIGFRRKKDQSVDAVAAEDDAVEAVAEPDEAEALPDEAEAVFAVEAVADLPFEVAEEADPASELESHAPLSYESDLEPTGESEVVADAEPDEAVSEPDAAESVPFYRREIGFRRRKNQSADAVAAEDDVVEAVVEPDEVEASSDEAVFALAAVADQAFEPAEADGADGAVEAVEAPAAEDKSVPFYRREIAFRRNKGVTAAALATAAVAGDEDDAAAENEAVDELPSSVIASIDAYSFGVLPPEGDRVEADSPLDAEPTHGGDVVPEDTFLPMSDAEPATDAEPMVGPADEADVAPEDALQPTSDTELPADVEPMVEPAYGTEVAFEDTFQPTRDADLVAETEPMADPVAETASELEGYPSPSYEMDALPTDESEQVPAEPETDATHDGAASFADEATPVDDATTEGQEPASGRSRRRKKGEAKSSKRSSGGKGRTVGLKIGSSQIAAAVIEQTGAGRELVELARRPLATGIVVDGEVRDLDALASAVTAFFDQEKLPKKDVRIGLASNRIGVRTFDLLGLDDEKRFDNAVRFKAHELLPVAAYESALDYSVLGERVNEDGELMRRVLLVVAPRDQIDPYAEVARRAGIKLSGIDLEALALLRAFVEPELVSAPTADDTAKVIVSIGHESTTLLVAGAGTCEFTRVFDWGGSVLEEAIATALEVRPAEAATILRHLSLSGPGRQLATLDEVSRAKALEAVQQRLTPFARELVNSLQFYQTQEGSLGIGDILLTGGASQLEGLGNALHSMIGVSVTVGDPLSRVIPSHTFDSSIESALGSLAIPIGLAIEDLPTRTVNLLPRESVSKNRRSTLLAVGVPIAAVVPLVAMGALYMGAHGKAVSKQAELDDVQAQIAAIPAPKGPTIEAGVAGDEAARATAVASVLGGRLAWDVVFRDMARVLPSNVWLKDVSATLPGVGDTGAAAAAVAAPGTAGVAPTPTAVVVDGYTYAQPDVARLLARLATLPSLARVTLTSSQRELVGGKDVVHFTIVADLNQSGGAS